MKLVTFASFILSFFLIGCQEQPKKEEQVLRPIKSILAKSPSDSGTRAFNGTSRTSQETNISFKVSGNIEELLVRVGERVKKGQVLARLESDTYQARLAQTKADVAKAFAFKQSAGAEYQRLQELIADNLVSQNRYEQSKAEAESSVASYQAALQAQSIAALDLGYTELQINSDCVVAELYVRENENINAGQSIAKASCGDIWEIVINVPEKLISSFSNGLAANITFPSMPNRRFTGRVTEIGIGTNTTSSYPITVQLEQPPENLRVNVAAEVSLLLPLPEGMANRVFVPLQAVASDQGGSYVYLVQKTQQANVGVLTRQNVEVGMITPFGLEITSGLQSNDEVLLAGHVNALDGMKVKISTLTVE